MNFDGARCHSRIDGFGRTRDHGTASPDHVFTAHLVGNGMCIRRPLRVEDHLGDAMAVPEVNKDQAAMVAPSLHPTGELHFSTDIGWTKVATEPCLKHRL